MVEWKTVRGEWVESEAASKVVGKGKGIGRLPRARANPGTGKSLVALARIKRAQTHYYDSLRPTKLIFRGTV